MIRQEEIDLSIDLHEASPEYPVINAMVAHENAVDLAVEAGMLLEFDGIQIGVEPNRIDVVTAVEGLSFEEAWRSRVASTYGEVPISILGLDDLLRNKRAVARPQDLLDVEWLERAKDRQEPC